jgi:glycosyltransferase involved in cell wall biosynthesis
LFVIESLGRAGAEGVVVDLAVGLVARGPHCAVAVLGSPYALESVLREGGVSVHRLDRGHRWNLWRGQARLRAVVADFGPDVVHAHLFFAAIQVALLPRSAGRFCRVVTLHNTDYDVDPATTPWLRVRRAAHGLALRRRSDVHIAVSDAVAQHYRRELGLRKVLVIHNAIDVDRYRALGEAGSARRSELLRDLRAPDAAYVILCPGRLARQKGHAVLLAACQRLRAEGVVALCLFAGEGPLQGEIVADLERRQLDGSVMLIGALPRDEVITLMGAVDVVVIPSLHEGFGLVALEAMAAGTPVVASRIDGLAEIVQDEISGLLVEPGDAAALASALRRLCLDSALRRRLAGGGESRAASFAVAQMVRRHEQAYRGGADRAEVSSAVDAANSPAIRARRRGWTKT